MSEHSHLDIDSLNAFAEGALQEHERLQCLAHLAECERCREIVFLTHEAEAPIRAIAPKPASGWRGWFAPIPVLAAAAAICIAVGGSWLYLRFRAPSPPHNTIAEVTQKSTVETRPPAIERQPAESVPRSAKSAHVEEQKRTVVARAFAPPSTPKDVGSESARAGTPTIPPPPEIAVPRPVPNPLPFSVPQVQPPPAIVEARAPEAGASISGTVTDPTGAVIPGASVHVNQLAGTVTRDGRSDASGAFQFAGLPAGRYELRVEALGFRTMVQQVDVQNREIAAVRPVLDVGSMAQSVTVEAASPTVQTSSAQIARKSRREPPEPKPLPSGLPITTTVTHAKVMLAIDSNGILFFSGNTGRSWKTVKPIWSGKVVDLVSPAEQPQPSTIAFQLTTDSDAIYLSKDGRHWYPAPSRP